MQQPPSPVAVARGQPVVLVDASYYVFYRFFATAKWFAFRKSDVVPALTDAAFQAAFVRHIEADVARWKKRYKLPPASRNVVFCRDCYRAEIWRRDLYPAYKGNREPNAAMDGGAFQALYAWVQAQGYPLVWHARLEADDLAGLMHQRLRQEAGVGPFVFITNDHDYLQAKAADTLIHQASGQDVYEAGRRKGTHDVEVKIAMGDASDNIAAVLAPAQLRAFAELDADGRAALLQQLGKEAAFARNRELMLWDCIPAPLREAFAAACPIVYV